MSRPLKQCPSALAVTAGTIGCDLTFRFGSQADGHSDKRPETHSLGRTDCLVIVPALRWGHAVSRVGGRLRPLLTGLGPGGGGGGGSDGPLLTGICSPEFVQGPGRDFSADSSPLHPQAQLSAPGPVTSARDPKPAAPQPSGDSAPHSCSRTEARTPGASGVTGRPGAWVLSELRAQDLPRPQSPRARGAPSPCRHHAGLMRPSGMLGTENKTCR